MDNFQIITKSNQLNEIFEKNHDKLLILMFYIKNNPDCRKAKSAFEKASMNHTITQFCLIDMDKFEGDSRFTHNINNMPRFDFYHMGNQIGTINTSNEKELENCIRSSEQMMMTQNNIKNNNTSSQNNTFGGGGTGMFNQYSQMPQFNPAQVQQQILNYAMSSNPAFAQQLMQNPQMLQQVTQQQIQKMQQQQMAQMAQMSAQMSQMAPQMPTQMAPQMVPQMAPMPPMTSPVQSSPNNFGKPDTSGIPPNFMSIPFDNSNTKIMEVLPTFQQMQQMFQIFQMMQQMGLISPTASPTIPNESTPKTEDTTTIELPNGDKLIPLPGGKYGLIKKN